MLPSSLSLAQAEGRLREPVADRRTHPDHVVCAQGEQSVRLSELCGEEGAQPQSVRACAAIPQVGGMEVGVRGGPQPAQGLLGGTQSAAIGPPRQRLEGL